MTNEIFDRETQLDLLVNVIPLFIMGFFIVGFLVFAPFGIDPLASAIQFGLIAIPFVLLTVLTYFAAVAVAGTEKSGPVYLPGQASVSGAEPLEVPGEEEAVPQDDEEENPELDGEDVAADEESASDDAAEDEDADEDTADAEEADGDDEEASDAEADDETEADDEQNA